MYFRNEKKKISKVSPSLFSPHGGERQLQSSETMAFLCLSLPVSIQFENFREGFLLAGLDHAPTTVREREDLGLIQPGLVCDWSVSLSPQEVRGVMQGNHRQG